MLEKIARLQALGWPIERLRIACCYVEPTVPPPDNYHAVLQVEINGGQAILDSRQSHVCSLEELARIGYRPDRIQAAGGSREWVEWRWQ